MKDDAMGKIKMLKGSQQCLAFGLLSLVALAGVPIAVMAMVSREDSPRGFFGFCFFISLFSLVGFPFGAVAFGRSVTARRSEKKFWNAARPYRIWGIVCATLGVVSSFVVAALVGFIAWNFYLSR